MLLSLVVVEPASQRERNDNLIRREIGAPCANQYLLLGPCFHRILKRVVEWVCLGMMVASNQLFIV